MKTEIRVPVSTGELLDKLSILRIKEEKISDPAKLKNVRREREILQSERDRLKLDDMAGEKERILEDINREIWRIEDEIRDCERRKDFGPAFVTLARSVYRTNDRRAQVKREINQLSGSRLVEEKSYTEYA